MRVRGVEDIAFPVLHLEISSGFRLGVLWPVEILVASREHYVKPPSIIYVSPSPLRTN